MGEHFWPKTLKLINEKYPDLIIELNTQSSSSIWSDLESGKLDIVVDAEPNIAESLFSKVLYTERFGIFCKKDSRFLESDKEVPFSFVARAFDKDRITIDQHLRKLKIPFQLLYSVESFIMSRSLVLEDVCVGVLPISIAKKYLEKGTIQYFGPTKKPITFGEHRICMTSLEQSRHEPKIEILSKILKSIALN